MIDVAVRTLNGKSYSIQVGEGDDDVYVKKKLFEGGDVVGDGLPAEQLKLVYLGKTLTGPAAKWNLQKDTVIVLLPDLHDQTSADVELDMVFVVDCTGSMGSYITQVKEHVQKIIEEIIASENANVRFALVKYKDIKDQYRTQLSPFTDDISIAKEYVATMYAGGGGDTPECVASGLNEVLGLDYRDTATKVCVLIADAPPHGLEDSNGDSYPDGDPSVELLSVCRQFVTLGVRLYSVGCEPAINNYPRTCSWMKWAAELTGGKYVSLANARMLADVIVGGCREQLNRDKYKAHVFDFLGIARISSSVSDEECEKVAQHLSKKGFKLLSVKFADAANPSVFSYVDVFDGAKTLAEAKVLCQSHKSGNKKDSAKISTALSKLDQALQQYASSDVITTIPVAPHLIRCLLEDEIK